METSEAIRRCPCCKQRKPIAAFPPNTIPGTYCTACTNDLVDDECDACDGDGWQMWADGKMPCAECGGTGWH